VCQDKKYGIAGTVDGLLTTAVRSAYHRTMTVRDQSGAVFEIKKGNSGWLIRSGVVGGAKMGTPRKLMDLRAGLILAFWIWALNWLFSRYARTDAQLPVAVN
jgi:hypothetical protein